MVFAFFANLFDNQIFWIIFWIAVFLIALGIELSTTQLVSIWFCGGAFVALILAICKVPYLWQIVIWVIVSGLFLVVSKLFFKKKFDIKETKTNADSLVNEEILVTGTVTNKENGQGKIRDLVWTICTDDESPITEGEFAVVKEIRGNKLFVTRKEN